MDASNNEKIIALLIDGDNVPSEYIDIMSIASTIRAASATFLTVDVLFLALLFLYGIT